MILGIDGKYLNGTEEIFVIGEVKEKEFMGVTKSNTSKCLQDTLRNEILAKGKIISVVNMDMSKLIKGAVREVAPEADIVADKFHIIKYTNRVIDLCRIATEKSVQEKFEIKRVLLMKTSTFLKVKNTYKWRYKAKRLKKTLEKHPEVKILWDLKNKLHGFYKCKSLETATVSWQRLLVFLDRHKKVHPELSDLKQTFLNWETEILNYFIYRTTNAYIEGINNRIETLKRKKVRF